MHNLGDRSYMRSEINTPRQTGSYESRSTIRKFRDLPVTGSC